MLIAQMTADGGAPARGPARSAAHPRAEEEARRPADFAAPTSWPEVERRPHGGAPPPQPRHRPVRRAQTPRAPAQRWPARTRACCRRLRPPRSCHRPRSGVSPGRSSPPSSCSPRSGAEGRAKTKRPRTGRGLSRTLRSADLT
ncbi:hypothetical protein SDC9_30469 [bioreactor metagenome]|uniref:Uncharacterized protein n=1 Tax=bioreactor metagenome TaxID=1076179 RepID=A0A644UZZ0_9ZZZZ